MTSATTFVALDVLFLFTVIYFAGKIENVVYFEFVLTWRLGPTDASPLVRRFNSIHLIPRWTRPWQNETGSDIFRSQMENPSEVFSVLLIIGGDIVQKAVAQMSGHRITFVAFSFGWVAYAFNSLMSAFGDGSLMPDPEFSSEVINVKSGIKKQNNSWLLCRLIRDLEREVTKNWTTWYEVDDQATTDDWIETQDPSVKCNRAGEGISSLLVTICEALPGAANPHRGWHFVIYVAIIIIQHAVAMIPIILYGNWSVLFITGIGTILAVCTTSLSEWRLEKYQARRHSKNSYAITRGNGHRHVFVIKAGTKADGKFPGLFLDDLAGAVRKAGDGTRLKTVGLAIAWVSFLIAAGGLKDHTWYVLIVGIIGMAQNIWVAGHHQTSKAHGIPVHIVHTHGLNPVPLGKHPTTYTKRGAKPVYEASRGMKVMEVLMEVEKDHPTIGAALQPEFFPPGSLRKYEADWWAEAKAHRKDPTKPFPAILPAPVPAPPP
ncbi:uncharacterized protein A1O9_05364 [Exophiala aquamarina CBS 119918]|uniref:Uncharacterized protein n=1 Tax=Exophiala aquamarina CBS 119918 TaxID=1182545 RepID=A0A072PCF3_9EURO|nr:uncharacterized protein A1O9_05364 [Exophiala aquamarina CBS 119918]KEF57447.1 hypothetical protein A1O9_05364 [Exophiala aquamarina CBS 119918]